MKVSLTSSANAELAEAQSFYTHSSDPRLGQAFALEFSRSIALMDVHPHIGSIRNGSIRQFALRRFPYTLFYQVREADLLVIAIFHQRRRPRSWLKRA